MGRDISHYPRWLQPWTLPGMQGHPHPPQSEEFLPQIQTKAPLWQFAAILPHPPLQPLINNSSTGVTPNPSVPHPEHPTLVQDSPAKAQGSFRILQMGNAASRRYWERTKFQTKPPFSPQPPPALGSCSLCRHWLRITIKIPGTEGFFFSFHTSF